MEVTRVGDSKLETTPTPWGFQVG